MDKIKFVVVQATKTSPPEPRVLKEMYGPLHRVYKTGYSGYTEYFLYGSVWLPKGMELVWRRAKNPMGWEPYRAQWIQDVQDEIDNHIIVPFNLPTFL